MTTSTIRPNRTCSFDGFKLLSILASLVSRPSWADVPDIHANPAFPSRASISSSLFFLELACLLA
jgi:hypothetical protein